MIKIERVQFPYCVTIPVSEKNSRDPDWYTGLEKWLSENVADYEIAEATSWIVVIWVGDEHDALLIKVAWEDTTPLPFQS